MVQFSSLYTGRLDRELGTDDSTTLFTTARRKAAINEAQEEFNEQTECFLRSSTFTIMGGTAEYNLNAAAVIASQDFVRFAKEPVRFIYTDASSFVTVLEGDNLVRRDIDWLNKYQPSWQLSTVAATVMQLPEFYYVREEGGFSYLGFTPVPSTGSSASAVAVVPYLARPTAMTSDTSEPYQVGANVRTDLRPYHQALVHFAAHQLEKLRRDDQASDRQLQKFLGYVARYLQNSRVKNGNIVTFAKNYFRARRNEDRVDPRTGV